MGTKKVKYIISLMLLALSMQLVFGVDRKIELLDSSIARASDTIRDSVFVRDRVVRPMMAGDSLRAPALLRDSLRRDTIPSDTLQQSKPKSSSSSFLDDILVGKNTDSLFYDVREKKVYIYDKGDVTYQNKNLTADFMRIDMNTREVFAHGVPPDSTVVGATVEKPVFSDNGSSFTMDTITYNLKSGKAKIQGVATQEGDGWLVGSQVKKMPDNAINILGGKYTTCDCTDHPHFYLAMTQAKMIPGKKIIMGPSYLVLEDVPLFPLVLPEAFFPITQGAQSGILMPTYGEDGTKGFFLRDMGYYFTFGDYFDLTLLGSLYSYGSWDLSASSTYVKRYKYKGSVSATYSSIKLNEKGDDDFSKQNATKITWSHSQDAKANPNATFSASVNFTTSGYSKYSATSMSDILATQTNSSISYSRNWNSISLSSSASVSQNSQTEAISVSLPTVVLSIPRFYPFKFGESIGSEKWYEKISMTYSGKMTNSVTTTEDEFFTKQTLQDMTNGIQHSIPVSASFKLFDYIDLSPSLSYTERWYFTEENRQWNPVTNEVEYLDPKYGFFRLYNYSASASASTTVYGTMQNKNTKAKLQAIRHTLTPSLGVSYAPDFSDQKYGYYKVVQSDSLGNYTTYSPYSNNSYGVPSSGRSMSLTFGLNQSLEAKVASKRDTSGVKKVKIIDQLSLSGSYNFLADSMKFSLNTVKLTTTIKNYGVNLSLGIDPYRVSPEGVRYDQLFFPGRLTSTSWSFSYTFRSGQRSSSGQGAVNDINQTPPEYQNPFYDPYGRLDPTLRRQYMTNTYYDFSLPWNFGFNYSVNYGISYTNNGTTGYTPNITQTLGFNGSATLTDKLGVTFSGSYDFVNNKISATQVSMNRDLHCWQMSFSWIPFGYYKSWSFNIGVKASSLSDLKYDKSQSMYEYMY
ncbi:MAG: putative LPS assembly protein LptD [Rikenellaceae bacterium]